MPKALPTTTANFRDIIQGHYLYVDKTQYLYELVKNPKGAWFLARPRRFGKSLLLSTLDELLRGQRELFRGLWIDSSDYDWTTYPVIRIDFGLYQVKSATQLEQRIPRYLQRIAQEYGITLADEAYDLMFEDLIIQLATQKPGGKQVVILIDVYLLDAFSYTQQGFSEAHLWRLVEALQHYDLDLFFTVLKVLFANIDYSRYLDNEKYYQTLFCLTFKLIGLRTDAEVKTNDGRIDAVVEVAHRIYLFEFKLNKRVEAALKQIYSHRYYEKYQLHSKSIIAVGVNFNTQTRTVADWKAEEVKVTRKS